MTLLWILSGILIVYAAESWLSCLRLGAFVRNSRWFYAWDSALVALPLLTLVGFLSLESLSDKLLIVPVALVGNFIGALASRQLRK